MLKIWFLRLSSSSDPLKLIPLFLQGSVMSSLRSASHWIDSMVWWKIASSIPASGFSVSFKINSMGGGRVIIFLESLHPSPSPLFHVYLNRLYSARAILVLIYHFQIIHLLANRLYTKLEQCIFSERELFSIGCCCYINTEERCPSFSCSPINVLLYLWSSTTLSRSWLSSLNRDVLEIVSNLSCYMEYDLYYFTGRRSHDIEVFKTSGASYSISVMFDIFLAQILPPYVLEWVLGTWYSATVSPSDSYFILFYFTFCLVQNFTPVLRIDTRTQNSPYTNIFEKLVRKL